MLDEGAIEMRWKISFLHDDASYEDVTVDEAGLAAMFAKMTEREYPCHVIAVTEAPKAAVLGEEVAVIPVSATVLSEVGGNRRWMVNGDPQEDWWVEVDQNGQRLPGEWEYDRDTGTVVCSIG